MEGALWGGAGIVIILLLRNVNQEMKDRKGCKAIDLTIWKTYLRWWGLYRGHIRCGQAAKSYLENARQTTRL